MRHPVDQGRIGRHPEEGRLSARAPRGAARHFQPANTDDVRYRPVRGLAFSLLFIGAAMLGGAALPFAFGEMFPRSFTATAVLGLEKHEAVSAMAQRMKAGDTLEQIVQTLDLAREPALAGAAPGPLAVATDLLAGTERTAARPAIALQRALASTLSLMPDSASGQLSLAVTTPDAVLSVRIANAFATHSIEQAAAQALDDSLGLTAARKAAEEAERALSDFTASHGSSDIDEASGRAAEIAARDADIATKEAALATLKSDSARVTGLKITDAVSSLAELGIDAPVFDDTRQKYITAKLELDRMAAELGPRHPRLLAARSAAEDARNRLQDALRKLDTVYKDKVKVATRALDEAKTVRARLDAGVTNDQGDLETLASLKHEAERLRADYLDKMDISTAAPRPPAPAHLIAPARLEAVIANGASPLFVSIAGAGIGLLLAFTWLYVAGRARVDEADPEDHESEDGLFAAEHQLDRYHHREAPARHHDVEERYAAYTTGDEDDDWLPPPAHNDDQPLAERLRAVLRRSAEMDQREAMRASGSDRQAELEEIRLRMASLRSRVEAYNARRASGRH